MHYILYSSEVLSVVSQISQIHIQCDKVVINGKLQYITTREQKQTHETEIKAKIIQFNHTKFKHHDQVHLCYFC